MRELREKIRVISKNTESQVARRPPSSSPSPNASPGGRPQPPLAGGGHNKQAAHLQARGGGRPAAKPARPGRWGKAGLGPPAAPRGGPLPAAHRGGSRAPADPLPRARRGRGDGPRALLTDLPEGGSPAGPRGRLNGAGSPQPAQPLPPPSRVRPPHRSPSPARIFPPPAQRRPLTSHRGHPPPSQENEPPQPNREHAPPPPQPSAEREVQTIHRDYFLSPRAEAHYLSARGEETSSAEREAC